MRILVVDDDALAAEMTAAVLEEGGCEAVMADSGAQALEILGGDGDFDAVVSDLNMPGLSGLDLFHRLRASHGDLPFILLSGDDPEDLRRQEPGLAACVTKDADLETTLMTAIAELRLSAAG